MQNNHTVKAKPCKYNCCSFHPGYVYKYLSPKLAVFDLASLEIDMKKTSRSSLAKDSPGTREGQRLEASPSWSSIRKWMRVASSDARARLSSLRYFPMSMGIPSCPIVSHRILSSPMSSYLVLTFFGHGSLSSAARSVCSSLL